MKPRAKHLFDILRTRKGGQHVPRTKKKPKPGSKAWAEQRKIEEQ